jgi:diguanylate cyclase (GGDEF)-like protein
VFRVALQRPFGSKSLSQASAHSGSDLGSLLDLQSLLKANQLLAQEIQLDALLRQMFSVLLENAGAEQGGIVLIDEGRPIVETLGGLVGQRRVETRRLSQPLSEADALLPAPLIDYVRLTRQILVINQPALDPRFAHSAYLAAQQPKSVLCLPVLYQGQLLALVYLENSLLEDAFTLQRQQTLELLSSQAAISLMNARLVEDLESKVAQRTEALRKMSMRDGLTGIANRRAFDESLQIEWRRSARLQQPLSLLMIDIDHFKQYNDHYGHIEGDACIQQVAQLLQHSAERITDSVARYGGEEFAVLLPQTDGEAAEQLARDCLAALAARALPHARSSTAAVLSLSIGVACMVGNEQGPEVLLRAADEALYRAKREGRNRVVRC